MVDWLLSVPLLLIKALALWERIPSWCLYAITVTCQGGRFACRLHCTSQICLCWEGFVRAFVLLVACIQLWLAEQHVRVLWAANWELWNVKCQLWTLNWELNGELLTFIFGSCKLLRAIVMGTFNVNTEKELLVQDYESCFWWNIAFGGISMIHDYKSCFWWDMERILPNYNFVIEFSVSPIKREF